MSTIEYKGHFINRTISGGWWESYVNGRFWKADTLGGIKRIIREAKKGNVR